MVSFKWMAHKFCARFLAVGVTTDTLH